MEKLHNKFMVVTLFAIAMGLLEAIVVVYLRMIYYPSGFEFPLTLIPPDIFSIELVREATTLIMLVSIGLLAGKSRHQKFAWFLFTFGVWDIIYYVGLKLFLGWPSSLLTWDILFLIPITCIGPVLAPVICSLTMIILASLVNTYEERGKIMFFGRLTWSLFVIGSIVIFFSFTKDYASLLYRETERGILQSVSEPGFTKAIASYIPEEFSWWIFSLGEALILSGIVRVYLINSEKKMQKNPKI